MVTNLVFEIVEKKCTHIYIVGKKTVDQRKMAENSKQTKIPTVCIIYMYGIYTRSECVSV